MVCTGLAFGVNSAEEDRDEPATQIWTAPKGRKFKPMVLVATCYEPTFLPNETLWNIWLVIGSLRLDAGELDRLAHFSVSSATSSPKSAGDAAWMRIPRSSYFVLISGRARHALISLWSISTISAGIFLGPAMLSQLSNSPAYAHSGATARSAAICTIG
jgi:hypothetical protein